MVRDQEIINIARQIVKNYSFKTNISGCKEALNYLVCNGFANTDGYGTTLNKEFVMEYKELLISSGVTIYEIMIIEFGPYYPIYFRNELLQFFIHNPKYKFDWDGYRGHVYNIDNSVAVSIAIENLCLSYDVENQEPVLSVFLKDLIAHQEGALLKFIEYFEISKRKHLKQHPYNTKQLFKGDWLNIEEEDIYIIILNGIEIINNIFMSKYNKPFFKETFKISDCLYFRPIFYPTKLNYYLYMMELYKIINGNIDTKLISTIINDENLVTEEMKQKYSLKNKSLFQLYQGIDIYTSKYYLNSVVQEKFRQTLKDVSKTRRVPAHDLFEDVYDKTFWAKQDDINKNIYILLNMIIKNESETLPEKYEEYSRVYGQEGRISLYNGFNRPPYTFLENHIQYICRKFDQHDSEILIAFKDMKDSQKQLFEYYKSKDVRLKNKQLKHLIKLLLKDALKPSEVELISFFKGYQFFGDMLKGISDDSFIDNGIEMYNDFVKRYPLENCFVLADMTDPRYRFDEILKLDTLRDSGLIYNSIFDYQPEINLTTNPNIDNPIQLLVNTWD